MRNLSLAALGAALAFFGLTHLATAQNNGAPSTIKVCTSVKGADCIEAPGPDTPVAAQFQESYQAYLKMKDAAHGGVTLTRLTAPDWSGLWNHAGGFSFKVQSNPVANAPGDIAAKAILEHCASFPCEGWMDGALTPAYALQYRQKLTAVAAGFEWDQLSDCLPAGYPRFLLEPVLKQFSITAQQTLWMNEWQGETRSIYTDGRGHIPADQAYALWDGDSIGFWDGDTLVVHTISVKSEELQRNQPSVSDQASTVERIRMIDPNTLEDDLTLYDPKALAKPWHVTHRYTRVTTPGLRMDNFSCEENNNVIQAKHGTSTFILPGETVMVKREYREPNDYQNTALNKAIAYGAELMKQDEAKAKARAKKK